MSKDKIYDTLEKVLIFAIGATAIVLMLIVVKGYLQHASQQEVMRYFTKMVWKLPIGIFLIKKVRDL